MLNKRLQKSETCAYIFLFAGSAALRFETACDNAKRDDGQRREEEPG
jgi:16S rRNA G966 N2-methylase RsmD